MSIRMVICWPSVSGYMTACWRALAKTPDIDLRVVVARTDKNFSETLLEGLNATLVPPEALDDVSKTTPAVVASDPQVVVLSGWAHPGFRKLAFQPELAAAKFAMTMDTPYQGTLRQQLGRFRHPSYFKRIERAIVPGERGFQMARRLAFAESKIRRGMYALDFAPFSSLWSRRVQLPGGWPRKWLFIARYHPHKAVDVLVKAYTLYRSRVEEPWPMSTMGAGALAPLIHATPGMTDLGFVQPADQPDVMLEHGAFVLSSRYEPWGVVVAEACAADLPVVCTEACSSSVELVRGHYNGLTCGTDDPEDLCRAMTWLHNRPELLPEFGACGIKMAEPFSAALWAERWAHMARDMAGRTTAAGFSGNEAGR